MVWHQKYTLQDALLHIYRAMTRFQRIDWGENGTSGGY